MKRLRPLFFTIMLCVLLAGFSRAASLTLSVRNQAGQYETRQVRTVSLVLDGEALETDIPAFILDNRTLVPVRVVSEELGAAVTWKQDTQQVQIENGRTYITLTIGSAEAVVDGKSVPLPDGVPATMAADGTAAGSLTRTMVPLRFVSEQLGAAVDFDNETSTVFVETAQEITYEMLSPRLADGVVTVTCDTSAEPNIFTLPGRVVADFPSGVLSDSSFGALAVDGTAIRAVRYNQYDTGYDVGRVARIVFDLNDGYTVDDLGIDFSGGVLTVTQPDPSETPPPAEEPEEPAEPEDPDTPLVVLDAGHGGSDTGAPYFGWNEKDLVLPITLWAGALLEEAGVRVEYTRSDDSSVSLAARAEQANTQGADLFVSVHANAFPQNPDVNGLETYYLIGGERAKDLAEFIHAAVLSAAGMNDRGTRTANFYVLRNTDMPAVLVETGYMTNEAECQNLSSEAYQQLLAQGIADGILAYLEAEA